MLEGLLGLLLLMPLAAAGWLGAAILLGQAQGERHEWRSSRVVFSACVGSFLITLMLAVGRLLEVFPEQVRLGRWLSSGDYHIDLLFFIDGLSLSVAVVSSLLSLLVVRFAVNYMHREAGFHRLFLVLSLFTAAMLLLVLSGNAVLTFLGWEVAGLCSYLLITFFQDRTTAAANATRVFVTNRIGDAGFLLGIGLAFYSLGGADWQLINARGLSGTQLPILAGCFLIAAMAKSAQVPFTPWLGRAMEGPTPSSALFYGAVMVHAGVYLLLRLQPLFEKSALMMAILVIVGLATVAYGFIGGLVQTDIKTALIFSTSTQVGLMVAACGLGFWRWVLLHLCCHALFRGYQFLSAPSILQQLREQRTRPVPTWLARQRRVYAAALQRFWLDDAADWSLVRPIQHLAQQLNHFDKRVVDRATGLPAPTVQALSSLAQWEERQLGAGRFLERPATAQDQGQGIVGRITEAIATVFHRFEEQMVFKAVGQGVVATSHRLGQELSRVERVVRRSWLWIGALVLMTATIIAVGGMVGRSQQGLPLLSALLVTPLVGIIADWHSKQARTAFALGLTVAAIELVLAIQVIAQFQSDIPGLQLLERFQILPWLSYEVGIDGISVLFLPLTALLTLFVMLYAQPHRWERPGAFVANILGMELALMGMFTSLNLAQFWFFAVMEIIPAALLIQRWGTSPARNRAAVQYVKAMLGGVAALLAGILLLGWNHAVVAGYWSFDWEALLATPVPTAQQSLIFLLLFGGLAVRLALFPLHSWLPIVAKHGTVAIGMVLLVGVKVGIYGLLRFVLPLLPAAAEQWAGWIVALGLMSMVYGALLAVLQIDLRRLLAFGVISQTGMLVAGLFSLNTASFKGSLLLSLNLGLSAAGLFVAAGLLNRRMNTTRFQRLGGLFDALPLLGLMFLVVVLGSIAMPGTPGFEAAHLVLEGLLEAFGWGVATVAAFGNVLAAGYLLWAYQRIFLARNPKLGSKTLADLQHRELVMAALLCAVMIGVGLYADPWIHMIGVAVDEVAQHFEGSASH